MRILLDTHTFLWFIAGSSKLSSTARQLIESSSSSNLLSLVSLWEIAIKKSVGKLNLAQSFNELVLQHVIGNGFEILPIEIHHIALVSTLPLHHRDPFDRLIIAQAVSENISILSVDSSFDAYPIRVVSICRHYF